MIDGFVVSSEKIVTFSRKTSEKLIGHILLLIKETYCYLNRSPEEIIFFEGENKSLLIWVKDNKIYGLIDKIEKNNIETIIKEKEKLFERLLKKRTVPESVLILVKNHIKETLPPFVFSQIESLLPQREISLKDFEEKVKELKNTIKDLLGTSFAERIDAEIFGILVEHGIHEPLK